MQMFIERLIILTIVIFSSLLGGMKVGSLDDPALKSEAESEVSFSHNILLKISRND